METIKKKINALKEDNEIKQDEIERLQEPFPKPCFDKTCFTSANVDSPFESLSCERNDRLN